MANFFTDEPDLLFHFKNNRIDEVHEILTGGSVHKTRHAEI